MSHATNTPGVDRGADDCSPWGRLAPLADRLVSTSTAVTYLAVGAAAMLGRSLGDLIGTLGTRLLGWRSIPMVMRQVASSVVLIAVALTGCTYSVARLDYERHPELQAIRLWSSRKDVPANGLGPVEAQRGGWTGCDAMATGVALQLLQDAHTMGGKGVVATRFQNPAHWAGRPRCRRNWVLLGHMTVHAIGTAVKMPPDGMAEATR